MKDSKDGDDARPLLVELTVTALSNDAAVSIARVARALRYETEIVRAIDDDGRDEDAWTVYCSKKMLPDHESLLAVQADLELVSAPFRGNPDGRGTASATLAHSIISPSKSDDSEV